MRKVYVTYDDYLMHHGVKGMKWGVRHEPERQVSGTIQGFKSIPGRIKNVGKYGWRQGHGKNVYSRIQNVKSDEIRQNRMSARQKQSLSNAEKYWKNRAAGKGIYGSGKRNIIKRSYDASRSHPAGYRNAHSILASTGDTPVERAVNSVTAAVGDEVLNKIFGHY